MYSETVCQPVCVCTHAENYLIEHNVMYVHIVLYQVIVYTAITTYTLVYTAVQLFHKQGKNASLVYHSHSQN